MDEDEVSKRLKENFDIVNSQLQCNHDEINDKLREIEDLNEKLEEKDD